MGQQAAASALAEALLTLEEYGARGGSTHGLDLAATMVPTKEVGGDSVDLIELLGLHARLVAGVAHALAGRPLPEVTPSWFWTDQYDHTLQHAGRSAPDDDLVLRPDPMAGFYLRDGVLTGVVTVDNGRDLRRAMKLLGRRIDPALLADPATDLRTVA